MNRDKTIEGRAMRLLEVNNRRERLGLITREQRMLRGRRISQAHYRAQHNAGATDYPNQL